MEHTQKLTIVQVNKFSKEFTYLLKARIFEFSGNHVRIHAM